MNEYYVRYWLDRDTFFTEKIESKNDLQRVATNYRYEVQNDEFIQFSHEGKVIHVKTKFIQWFEVFTKEEYEKPAELPF